MGRLEQIVRTSTENTRSAIRRAAPEMFCQRGYRATTLEEIGAEVGLTRGTVLHHFSSKAELLATVTGPYLRAVDELLSGADVNPSPAARREFIGEFVDLLCENRGAMRVLANDVAARAELGLGEWYDVWGNRLVAALFGSTARPADVVRGVAALGALSFPVARNCLDLDNPEIRNGLIEAALRAADGEIENTTATAGLAVAK